VVVRAEGHNLAFKPTLERTLSTNWSLGLQVETSRQWIARPLDSFWDAGPQLTLSRRLPNEGQAGLAYRFRERWFDERPARQRDGTPLNETLDFAQHELEVFWKQRWGSEGRWRMNLRGGILGSADNGGGFYDYTRYHVDAGLRYVGSKWEISTEARLRWYFYPIQPANFVGGPSRHRSDLNLTARGEWTLRKGVRVFAEYLLEVSDENGLAADYSAQSISAGISLEM
jgi:hypothetical protein